MEDVRHSSARQWLDRFEFRPDDLETGRAINRPQIIAASAAVTLLTTTLLVAVDLVIYVNLMNALADIGDRRAGIGRTDPWFGDIDLFLGTISVFAMGIVGIVFALLVCTGLSILSIRRVMPPGERAKTVRTLVISIAAIVPIWLLLGVGYDSGAWGRAVVYLGSVVSFFAPVPLTLCASGHLSKKWGTILVLAVASCVCVSLALALG
jgi:hypothetical protein